MSEVWQDNSGFTDDSGVSPYNSEVQAATDKRKQHSGKKNTGCLAKFSWLKCLWSTKWTQANATKEDLIRSNIRELFIYILFLTTALMITFNMTDPIYYYHTKVLQDLFIENPTSTGITFKEINTISDWWSFVETDQSPLLNGVYWDTWYNGENITVNEQNYIFYENKLLGVPRIRQLRVREGTCKVNDDFIGDITKCYADYNLDNLDTEDFGDTGNSAFNWLNETSLQGSGHHSWLGYTYDGSGYIQDLKLTRSDTENSITELKSGKWLDRQTRVVFIDFTVYNANINLFCVIRLTTEFPPTGGAITSWNFRTVKMLTMDYGWDKVVKGLYIFYMIMVGYYIIEEIIEISVSGAEYFCHFWNWLDIVIIISSVIACAFKIYQENLVSSQIEVLKLKTDSYPDFEFISFWTERFIYMIAITVFFLWIKLFKYISFNKTLKQLQTTLSKCAFDIVGFLIMFMIIFVAYAQLGYLVFGSSVADFNTPSQSMYTLFRIILGDFNFHQLERANYILGPAYFISYVILVFFILLNMFLAIINDTYSEVKADMALQEDEFELADYIQKGYDKVLRKLKLRSDHLSDLQDVVEKAGNKGDSTGDRKLDFEEWKNDLKSRGIPEAEIEAVFAKYDDDGDKVLNEEEQRRLRMSLERQKLELQERIEEAKGTVNRNGTTVDSENGYQATESSYLPQPSAGVQFSGNDELLEKLAKYFVGQEEFRIHSRRIDRLERHVQTVSTKIDGIIVKLDEKERSQERKRDNLSRVVDRELSYTDSSSLASALSRRTAPEPPKN